MAPRAGLEPATDRLTADCSTTELPRNTIGLLIKKIKKTSKIWRLGAESNRCARLCRPLHHHSATEPNFRLINLLLTSSQLIKIIRLQNKNHINYTSCYIYKVFIIYPV